MSSADTAISSEPYLRVDAISKTFGSIRALDRADFEVGRGEVMALVGENGAGKSTLVKILAGMYPPDEGRIRLGGRDVHFGGSTQSEHAGIAVVQQELSLVPSLSDRRQRVPGGHQTRLEDARPGPRPGRRLPYLEQVGLGPNSMPAATVEHLKVAERQLIEVARLLARDAQGGDISTNRPRRSQSVRSSESRQWSARCRSSAGRSSM